MRLVSQRCGRVTLRASDFSRFRQARLRQTLQHTLAHALGGRPLTLAVGGSVSLLGATRSAPPRPSPLPLPLPHAARPSTPKLEGKRHFVWNKQVG
jgi:hypothetical protein